MAQGGAQVASIALNRAGAATSRKMILKELGNRCLIDARNAQTAIT
jgi:hypothetical protein